MGRAKSKLKRFLKHKLTNFKLMMLVTIALVWMARPIVLSPTADATLSDSVDPFTDVQALVSLGPRVAGTSAAEKASQYLLNQYHQAGYETEVQTFTYPKFRDLGSGLTIEGRAIEGWAYNGSISGQMSGRLVTVPNFGQPKDFAQVPVKGAVAIVRRGGMSFSEKVNYAATAGAIGLIIVNNAPENIHGTLTSEPAIPVLGLSGQSGDLLLQRTQNMLLTVNLTVNTQKNAVARNVIAHLPGVRQPDLILGGHYDSVMGSPGANDNASGTAVVLAIAREVSRSTIARHLWFIAFDGEEDGLQGSQAFVDRANPQFLSKLKGMVNFDMVAVNDALQVDGSLSLKAFSKGDGATSKNPAFRLGSSDHATFKSQNVPILFFSRGYDRNYHSPKDQTITPKLLRETQQAALTVIKQILSK